MTVTDMIVFEQTSIFHALLAIVWLSSSLILSRHCRFIVCYISKLYTGSSNAINSEGAL